MTTDDLIGLDGHFTWNYGQLFFVETQVGNFVWSDPDYQGDNTLKSFRGSYKKWCKLVGIPYGRDKGRHYILDYCGKDVKLVDTK